MAGYICQDPDCTDSVAWHLIHGNWDCLADNQEAVADFARAAEANMPMPEITLNMHVTCAGYQDQSVNVILVRLPTEEEQADAGTGPVDPVELEEITVPVPGPPEHETPHDHEM